jgi:outer membrane protein assembly factor BamB
MSRPGAACAALLVLAGAAAAADRWTEFRGPSGTGHSDSTGLPREWSEARNVVWKTRVHGRGWSSPVVLGKQVWLTTATPEGHELSVLAIDRDDGRVLFDVRVFHVARPEDTRQYNSFASPTPVIEDGRVYVHFGSYGTAALDTRTGKVLWERRDLPCNHWRGPGSSPILHRDLLIVHFDGYDVQYAVALDKRTGRTVWRSDRSHDFGTDDGDQKKGYATPVVIEASGRAQLISPAAKAVLSLDPLTGREIWHVRHAQHSAAARPLFADGLVYVASGRGKAELLAIRPDGHGDVTGTHVAWKALRGIGASPSPVLVGGYVYSVTDKAGVVTCLDARTGAEVWQRRVGGGAHTASPLFADGAIYFFAEDGSAVALEPGPESRELGRGALGEGGVMATPAIAGQSIFLRTESHLYRLEQAAWKGCRGVPSDRTTRRRRTAAGAAK